MKGMIGLWGPQMENRAGQRTIFSAAVIVFLAWSSRKESASNQILQVKNHWFAWRASFYIPCKGYNIHLCSSHQLPCLGPLKSFLSWYGRPSRTLNLLSHVASGTTKGQGHPHSRKTEANLDCVFVKPWTPSYYRLEMKGSLVKHAMLLFSMIPKFEEGLDSPPPPSAPL